MWVLQERTWDQYKGWWKPLEQQPTSAGIYWDLTALHWAPGSPQHCEPPLPSSGESFASGLLPLPCGPIRGPAWSWLLDHSPGWSLLVPSHTPVVTPFLPSTASPWCLDPFPPSVTARPVILSCLQLSLFSWIKKKINTQTQRALKLLCLLLSWPRGPCFIPGGLLGLSQGTPPSGLFQIEKVW